MIDRPKYEVFKASGKLDVLRDNEIHLMMQARYRDGAETRIVCNMLKEPTNPEYIREFEEHEAYSIECKARVDAILAEFEKEATL
jgi:hypothetical protein